MNPVHVVAVRNTKNAVEEISSTFIKINLVNIIKGLSGNSKF